MSPSATEWVPEKRTVLPVELIDSPSKSSYLISTKGEEYNMRSKFSKGFSLDLPPPPHFKT